MSKTYSSAFFLDVIKAVHGKEVVNTRINTNLVHHGDTGLNGAETTQRTLSTNTVTAAERRVYDAADRAGVQQQHHVTHASFMARICGDR